MAIVFIDACGYSLAVRETEMRTLSTIRADLNLASEVVVALGGEVTGIAGDGFCATFRSVSVAVEASLRVQETLSEQVGNYDRGFRIGKWSTYHECSAKTSTITLFCTDATARFLNS